MSTSIYKFLNPIVKTLLRSPFHGMLSRNTLILHYTGVKSGRAYALPVSYLREGNDAFCFTGRSNRWWRNLKNGRSVRLTLRGRRVDGIANVESEDEAAIAAILDRFLRATPRDAGPSGVRLDKHGVPNPEDVAVAATKLVSIRISLVAG